MLEKTLESPLDCNEIKPINAKGNQSWIVLGRNDTEAEAPILGPPDQRTDSFEKILMLGKIKAGGEGDKRGWDGWMASPTPWTWVWASSGSWWWTGNPGVLQSMGLQRVGHHWATELTDWPSTSTLVRMFFQKEWSSIKRELPIYQWICILWNLPSSVYSDCLKLSVWRGYVLLVCICINAVLNRWNKREGRKKI